MSPHRPTTDHVYTSKGFEAFLQQAESSGISRKRQSELIAEFLAKDVTLDVVLLDTVQGFMKTLARWKKTVFCFLLLVSVIWYIVYREYLGRSGKMEYEEWQMDLAAQLKHFQMKFLWLGDWTQIFYIDCAVYNPIYYLMYTQAVSDRDCVLDPPVMNITNPVEYAVIPGRLGERVLLPFVLQNGQADWAFNANNTLSDLDEILEDHNALYDYPCIEYPNHETVSIERPLRALVEGTLKYDNGDVLDNFSLVGCNKHGNRVLRKLTQRPIFLDADTESLAAIKVIVSKGIPMGDVVQYHLKREDTDQEMWVAQVLGTSTVVVSSGDCPDHDQLQYKLKPGDIVAIDRDNTLTLEIRGGDESLIIQQQYQST